MTLDTIVLTERQIEVLQCAADGMSLIETASRLWVEVQTIKFHRTGIISRLDAKNITHAVAIAIRSNMIQ